MKKILLTGFEAFNGRNINPAEEIVKTVNEPEDTKLVRLVLPVEFRKSTEILEDIIEKERPDIILSLGQAGNVPWLKVERLAVNLDSSLTLDAKEGLPDSSGDNPLDRKIYEDGPDGYLSKLPTRELVRCVNEAGIPCGLSYTGGTYVCNHVMYVCCHLAKKYPGMKTGFVHVPFLPEQLGDMANKNGRYVMELSRMIQGVQIILNELAK